MERQDRRLLDTYYWALVARKQIVLTIYNKRHIYSPNTARRRPRYKTHMFSIRFVCQRHDQHQLNHLCSIISLTDITTSTSMSKLKLADVFMLGTTTNSFDRLVACLLDANGKQDGWLYEHFDKSKVTVEEVYLQFRALLVSQCLKNSDLTLALARSLVGNKVIVIDHAFLKKVFAPRKKQEMQDIAIIELLQWLENPRDILSRLETDNEQSEEGWILRKWFSGQRNKQRLTDLERIALQVNVYVLLDTMTTATDRSKVQKSIEYAWGSQERKIQRNLKKFHDSITVGLISLPAKKCARDGRRDDEYASLPVPIQGTPARTRAIAALLGYVSASPQKQTPKSEPPHPQTPRHRSISITRTLEKVKAFFTPARLAPEKKNELLLGSHTGKDDTDSQEDQDPSRQLMEDFDRLVPLQMDDFPSPDGESRAPNDESDDESISFPPTDEETNCCEEEETETQGCTDELPPDQLQAVTDWDALEDKRLKEEKKEHTAECETEYEKQKSKDALALMENVMHIAAVGQPSVAKQNLAMMTGSMKNANAKMYLCESGYAEKKQKKVITRKKSENEARKRRAAKRNEEPALVEEVATLKYKSPLANTRAAATAKKNFNEYLLRGEAIPQTLRPTNVKITKIDCLIRWFVENCGQYRPGKMRNVRFKKEGITLKNIPLYIRYGSFADIYAAYSDAVASDLKIGNITFRVIVKAVSRKGTYNQGLSYFYVDFIEMIALLGKMFGRLQKILNETRGITLERRQEIQEWLEHAIENTEFSSQYLRHGYYSDIQKSCTDGYCCAAHALGTKCSHEHTFDNKHKLALALTNHALILYVLELLWEALSDEEYEAFADELHSMVELAHLSSREMEFYARHLIRGWWQTTAINELKRLLLKFPWLKGLILDYKNKLLPKMKYEPMTLFFSKSGISILGCMVMWAGSKVINGKEVEGLFVWFIDIIMENVSSQKAKDLMPGITTIRDEVQQEYFIERAGETKGLFILSDNALVAASNLAFINALNGQDSSSSSPSSQLTSDETANETTVGAQAPESDDERSEPEQPEPQLPKEDSEDNDESSSSSQSTSDEASKETAAETQATAQATEIDEFVARMERLFAKRLSNWGTKWKPEIIRWLTWEAQQGKSQLDTHFAYINKHLTKACLHGGIDYLDPKKTFEAFAYKGGPSATTTLLMQQLPAAQEVHQVCEKTFTAKDKEGLNSVHDIRFERKLERTEIVHAYFANLETGAKRFYPDQSWPSNEVVNQPIGEVLDRHSHAGAPLFFPFKQNLVLEDGGEDLMERDPDQCLLPTCIYWALKKHTADIAFADEGENTTSGNSTRLDEKVKELTRRMQIAVSNAIECDDGSAFPPKLDTFWAKKKNKMYLSLSAELVQHLQQMYDQGKGTDNRAIRMSAERAACILRDGILAFRWDQQLICSVGKVKSFFGAKHQEEQKENDKKGKDTWDARKARANALIKDNTEAEAAILREVAKDLDEPDEPTLVDSQLKHFAKVKANLLKAFVKCRVLHDATSTSLDKMPNKGTLKVAELDLSDRPVLIQWAHNKRAHPVIAIIPNGLPTESSLEEDAILRDQSTYGEAVNSQREETVFDVLEEEEETEVEIEEVNDESDDEESESESQDEQDSDDSS